MINWLIYSKWSVIITRNNLSKNEYLPFINHLFKRPQRQSRLSQGPWMPRHIYFLFFCLAIFGIGFTTFLKWVRFVCFFGLSGCFRVTSSFYLGEGVGRGRHFLATVFFQGRSCLNNAVQFKQHVLRMPVPLVVAVIKLKGLRCMGLESRYYYMHHCVLLISFLKKTHKNWTVRFCFTFTDVPTKKK